MSSLNQLLASFTEENSQSIFGNIRGNKRRDYMINCQLGSNHSRGLIAPGSAQWFDENVTRFVTGATFSFIPRHDESVANP